MTTEAFSATVRRIIEENASLFDYMAKELPLPARLSAEEEEVERLIRKWGPKDDARLPAGEAERILRTQNPHAESFSAEEIRMLVGSGDAPTAAPVLAE